MKKGRQAENSKQSALAAPSSIYQDFPSNGPSQNVKNWQRRASAHNGGIFFYVLPIRLIEAIEQKISPSPFADHLGQHEKHLSRQCQLEFSAGFLYGADISYSHLVPRPPLTVPSQQKLEKLGWGLSDARIRLNVSRANPLLAHYDNVARGYVGWLLTNPEFSREHDEIVSDWSENLRSSGRLQTNTQRINGPSLENAQLDPKVRSFLLRWRLMKLAGPELPVPMLPMMAGVFPVSILRQLMDAGGIFNYPDTFPVPSRDELRSLLGDALAGNQDAAHLAGWHRIISRDNLAKDKIAYFGRVRQVYHFWRLVQLRYGEKVAHRQKIVRTCIGELLATSEMSVRSMIDFITKQLGEGWAERPAPLTVTSLSTKS